MMKLRYFVLLVCVIVKAQGVTEVQKQLLRRVKMECIIETGINIYNVRKLEKGDWNINDPKIKNFSHCLLVKSELMSENGVVRMDMALSKVPPGDRQEVTELIDKCISSKFVSPYETAWKYLKCYHKNAPKHSLLF